MRVKENGFDKEMFKQNGIRMVFWLNACLPSVFRKLLQEKCRAVFPLPFPKQSAVAAEGVTASPSPRRGTQPSLSAAASPSPRGGSGRRCPQPRRRRREVLRRQSRSAAAKTSPGLLRSRRRRSHEKVAGNSSSPSSSVVVQSRSQSSSFASNPVSVQALPIFLDDLVPDLVAILFSVTLILLFGEIIPQSVCSRYGLAIGAAVAPAVRVLMWFWFPVAYPISKHKFSQRLILLYDKFREMSV
nr:DUF21 domain-containing protein At2g14520-like isoform X1 [Ipomoea trifida]